MGGNAMVTVPQENPWERHLVLIRCVMMVIPDVHPKEYDFGASRNVEMLCTEPLSVTNLLIAGGQCKLLSNSHG